ncbi:MAG TPA: glycosyltransferase family 2 protein [Chloroflexota bacterium]|nr:glycosyltransferase family 2 protein [Chloroflexota bacterium]
MPYSHVLFDGEPEAVACPDRSLEATYILPIRRETPMPDADLAEMARYVQSLSAHVEVIIVDASPQLVFEGHGQAWGHFARHLQPEMQTLNGKVANVLTGVRHARYDRLIIADDDVRYSLPQLARIVRELRYSDIVRPQNYFDPLPWHARWDTARSLLNRVTGGDWPGTLGVRRSILLSTGGYDGSVLFENLELVRTINAAGGREAVPLDLFVRRLPPDADHFWSQRTRQAYDELARPVRLLVWLSVLPALLLIGARRQWGLFALGLLSLVGLAEAGRRRANGAAVFPWTSTLFAPAWVLERSICSWLAVGMRLTRGGVPYRGRVLQCAATPVSVLEHRHRAVRTEHRRRVGIPTEMIDESEGSVDVSR